MASTILTPQQDLRTEQNPTEFRDSSQGQGVRWKTPLVRIHISATGVFMITMGVQELMTGDVLTPGVSLSSKQLQRMVTALDLASDKTAEIGELEAQLLQAKSKALLYEVP